jgi:hypothetical protein
MLNNVSVSLVSIETNLQRLGREVLLRSLRTGLSAEAVRTSLGATGLASTSELEALYAWRNGTSASGGVTLDDIHFFPGFYLLSIEDAITNYRAFVTDTRWRLGWLPIFANGGGDFYVLDLGSRSTNPVRHFRIDESEHPVEFNSLSALLATLAAAFERGIFVVDPNGYMEMDDLVFNGLAAELNPDVEWWRG